MKMLCLCEIIESDELDVSVVMGLRAFGRVGLLS